VHPIKAATAAVTISLFLIGSLLLSLARVVVLKDRVFADELDRALVP
jgi:hypothetical protein